jgi:MoxR-like ATPase
VIVQSAIIGEAARQTRNKLVRFNMSSRVTIDDLLGKVIVKTEDGAETFLFTKQPFTEAFEKGYWLLLDELNLAPDSVLQAIEEALDTDSLKLHDSSEASEHVVTIQKHPGFRLFATQNPNTGYFKGKRETLSASFLTRFQPLVYTELPEEDLKLVIQGRFQETGGADGSNLMDTSQNLTWLAGLMVKFHVKLKGAMTIDSSTHQVWVQVMLGSDYMWAFARVCLHPGTLVSRAC